MVMIQHEHIKKASREWEYEDGKWQSVLRVDTDLQLDPGGRGYDPEAERELLDVLVKHAADNPTSVDRIAVRSLWVGG
jgi:hypothetical protein